MSELIDPDFLNELIDFMGDSYDDIKRVYIDSTPLYLLAIDEGFAEGDAQKIFNAAHPFASSSGNLGLVILKNRAAALERLSKDVVDGAVHFDALSEHVGALRPLYESSVSALNAFNS